MSDCKVYRLLPTDEECIKASFGGACCIMAADDPAYLDANGKPDPAALAVKVREMLTNLGVDVDRHPGLAPAELARVVGEAIEFYCEVAPPQAQLF